jgi:hypothetical protein
MRIELIGRKRHIVVDTDGRLLTVDLTTADISDSAGAHALALPHGDEGHAVDTALSHV